MIAADGPISVADYMAQCLADPTHGYYTTRDPLGAAGDFVTAPEISQMFGEIVGAWLVEAWQAAGAPEPVILAELGPGRGTLMDDIWRTASTVPAFPHAASIHLVETSPVLQRRQAERLAGLPVTPSWHARFGDIPEGFLLLVANEFFDALPIRQYVRSQGRWRERAIGLDHTGALAFGVGAGLLDGGPEADEGEILEIAPAADAITAEMAQRIAANGGAALIIDYGYAGTQFGETLQAVRGHARRHLFDSPGETDLTAHVDFAALRRRANAEGAAAYGPIAQSDFLLSLGLLERAGQLGAGKSAEEQADIVQAVERLAGADQMGRLFKVLALAHKSAPIPQPFDRRD